MILLYFKELEIALDHANRANVDAQKNIKRYQDNIRELQVIVSFSFSTTNGTLRGEFEICYLFRQWIEDCLMRLYFPKCT